MALKQKPVTGMKDIMPEEMAIRDYLIALTKETYQSFGFASMETPCIEHLENLTSKQGGDNEKLIFKILKRGDKLKLDTAQVEEDVTDGGLRYDLTVPLARYYANYNNQLPAPFKALQIGNVWRADRPQKGRYRQFMQCDIDILGESSYLAEVELILATTTLLGKIGFKDFTVSINDRRFLTAMAAYSGFAEADYDAVLIVLDKMDKIGAENVQKELEDMGYAQETISKYLQIFQTITKDLEGVQMCQEMLADYLDTSASRDLERIIGAVEAAKTTSFKLKFEPTMVRGQSYYTGIIFEIAIEGFSGSVAGGGRYDKMIGRFTGKDTPAVGFSIGFERIVLLLLESGFQVPGSKDRIAYLLEKDLSAAKVLAVMERAAEERNQGIQVQIVVMKKNKKFQKEQLVAQGYDEIIEFYSKELGE